MRTAKIIAAGLLTSAALAAPAAAHAQTGGPSGPRDYADGVQVATVGAARCDEPVSRRTGNWLCLSSPAGQATGLRAATAGRGPAVRALSGHCTAQGCWDVYSAVDSDFYTTGYFGYGGRTLGTVELYFEVKLTGAQSRSKPVYFIPSTSVRSLEIEGERLYYSSAHPEGKPVRPSTWSAYTHGAVAAGQRVDWRPNGYKGYENTVQHGSVVHEWVWTKSGYSGDWWLYGKSVKFDRTSSSYRFGSSTYLGKSPVAAGWHPPA